MWSSSVLFRDQNLVVARLQIQVGEDLMLSLVEEVINAGEWVVVLDDNC